MKLRRLTIAALAAVPVLGACGADGNKKSGGTARQLRRRPPSPPVPGGTVTVTALDCQGEAVTVHNGGSSPTDLTGWSIHDRGPNFTYRFPAGYTLAPEGKVTVRSGGPAEPGELAWTNSPVWNNGGDTAYLVDAGGTVVSTRSC